MIALILMTLSVKHQKDKEVDWHTEVIIAIFVPVTEYEW